MMCFIWIEVKGRGDGVDRKYCSLSEQKGILEKLSMSRRGAAHRDHDAPRHPDTGLLTLFLTWSLF